MDRMEWIFGSPILQLRCPVAAKLNKKLKRLILRLEKQEHGVKQSNRGGWQSEKNLHTIQSDAVRNLLSFIDDATCRIMAEVMQGARGKKIKREWEVIAWANVNRQMDFNSLHYHVGSFWSGV